MIDVHREAKVKITFRQRCLKIYLKDNINTWIEIQGQKIAKLRFADC